MLGIVNLHLRVEELADIFLVILRGNPSLTELQTDVIKGNLLGQRLLQCGLGLLQGGNDLGVIGMFLSQFNGIGTILGSSACSCASSMASFT